MAPPPAALTATILDPRPEVTRVALDATSWVDVIQHLVAGADELHDELAAMEAWRQGRVFRYERWIDEPRLGAWQAGAERHPALVEVENWLTRRYQVGFNGVALARYRHERDGVGWHRDKEMGWLDDTVIGVLTLGARRPWRLKPRQAAPASGPRHSYEDHPMQTVELRPGSGDLLVMGGRCQADWLHAVPQVPGRCASRISAQWRWTSRRGTRQTGPSYFAPRYFSR